MPLTLTWVKDLQFTAEDDKGHGIVLESKRDGAAAGFTPMQLPLRGFTVAMEGDRATEHPKRFTEMRFTYTAVGDIPRADLDEAIRMSEEKYCSVSATLKGAPKMVIQSEVIAA